VVSCTSQHNSLLCLWRGPDDSRLLLASFGISAESFLQGYCTEPQREKETPKLSFRVRVVVATFVKSSRLEIRAAVPPQKGRTLSKERIENLRKSAARQPRRPHFPSPRRSQPGKTLLADSPVSLQESLRPITQQQYHPKPDHRGKHGTFLPGDDQKTQIQEASPSYLSYSKSEGVIRSSSGSRARGASNRKYAPGDFAAQKGPSPEPDQLCNDRRISAHISPSEATSDIPVGVRPSSGGSKKLASCPGSL
jgi:hypothetical protein